MSARVLIVDPARPVASAVARVLARRGHRSTIAGSCADACGHPGPFDCGVFAVSLPDGDGVSLAGWLVAEERMRSVVFFDDTAETQVRLRASNLGSFVHKDEGVKALCDAVDDAVGAGVSRAAVADGTSLASPRAEIKSGRRKKRPT